MKGMFYCRASVWPRYPAPGTHHTMCASTRVGQAPNYPAEILEMVAQIGVSLNYIVLGWLEGFAP